MADARCGCTINDAQCRSEAQAGDTLCKGCRRLHAPQCLIGQGFEGACQERAVYAVQWTDNGDEGHLCEAHAASARALSNGRTMTLRSLPTAKQADDRAPAPVLDADGPSW